MDNELVRSKDPIIQSFALKVGRHVPSACQGTDLTLFHWAATTKPYDIDPTMKLGIAELAVQATSHCLEGASRGRNSQKRDDEHCFVYVGY